MGCDKCGGELIYFKEDGVICASECKECGRVID